jgi:hypothetical protein
LRRSGLIGRPEDIMARPCNILAERTKIDVPLEMNGGQQRDRGRFRVEQA